jgi:CRISPR/Cas system CSM-associated protein Csm3 (group 7 of RAMP superfamily)
MTAEQVDLIFGFGENTEKERKKKGLNQPIQGSRLIVSPAHLFIDEKVADGQKQIEELYSQITEQVLPYLVHRDHVRINHRGVADSEEHGKFENEYLPKGLQFVFELELWAGAEAEDRADWQKLLQALRHPLFRIGGGTRKGFGKLKVKDIDEACYDLRTNQLEAYLSRPSSLHWNKKEETDLPELQTDTFQTYTINLQPRDFFLFDGQFDLEFSGGNNQKRPDFAPKREYVLKYKNGKYEKSYRYLVPATSIKGALAHRFAYHYNKNTNNFVALDAEALQKRQDEFLNELEELYKKEVDSLQHKSLEELQALEQKLAEKSQTIRAIEAQIRALQDGSESAILAASVAKSSLGVQKIFGYALNTKKKNTSDDTPTSTGQRGRLIIEDIYLSDNEVTKVFNHVKIDRFTGGAVDTALFTEQVLTQKSNFTLTMHLEKGTFDGDEHLANAWEKTLNDLKEGRLPLGGGVMRGHGMMMEYDPSEV